MSASNQDTPSGVPIPARVEPRPAAPDRAPAEAARPEFSLIPGTRVPDPDPLRPGSGAGGRAARPWWRPELRFTPVQIIAHVAAWVPAILIGVDYFRGGWTVNPIQYLTFRTGWAALTLLVASLACTPANTLLNFKEALKIRRPLGLYAFLYALVHFLIFVAVDYGLDPGLIYEAIFEKRYALVGFAALLILLPMALTSTRGWQRRLGKNWKRLHQLVYLAAILAVVHYLWLVKSDLRKPMVYAGLVAVLLLARAPRVRQALVHVRNQVVARLTQRNASTQERR